MRFLYGVVSLLNVFAPNAELWPAVFAELLQQLPSSSSVSGQLLLAERPVFGPASPAVVNPTATFTLVLFSAVDPLVPKHFPALVFRVLSVPKVPYCCRSRGFGPAFSEYHHHSASSEVLLISSSFPPPVVTLPFFAALLPPPPALSPPHVKSSSPLFEPLEPNR